MIMRKLVYVAVVGLTMGSSLSIFAQEPEKKDTTVVNPENSLAFMRSRRKKTQQWLKVQVFLLL